MSLVDALGSQVRSTAADLPLAEINAVLHRLRAAVALLRGVRGPSSRPVGLARLAHATEHAEHAGYALRVAQDAMGEYLAAIGLTAEQPPPRPDRPAPPHRPTRAAVRPAAAPVPAARRPESWWTRRVDRLVAADDEAPPAAGAPAASSVDLLAAIVERVRARDRAGLRRALRAAPVPVGLGMSGLAADGLRRAAERVLGRPAGAGDVAELRRRTAGVVGDLLPGADPRIAEMLTARACRLAPSSVDFPAPHPADAAVTGAVLLGALDGVPATRAADHGYGPRRPVRHPGGRPPQGGSQHG